MLRFSANSLSCRWPAAPGLVLASVLCTLLCWSPAGFSQIVEALFIVNETSSGGACGRQWPGYEAMLKDAGFVAAESAEQDPTGKLIPYRVVKTSGPQDASTQAEQQFERWRWGSSQAPSPEQQFLIVAVGGDGTISEVVQEFPHNDRVVFGILPCGTGNDISRSLGIPQGDIPAALQVLRNGKPIKYGAYKVTVNTCPDERSPNQEVEQKTLWSLDAVDVGVSADAGLRKYRHDSGRSTSCLLRMTKRQHTYTASLLLSLARWRPKPMRLSVDGQTKRLHGPLNFLVASCGDTVGGGTQINPEMSPESMMGFMAYTAGAGRCSMLKGFIDLNRGEIPNILLSRQFNSLTLKAASGLEPQRVQVDGEPVYQTPLSLEWNPGVFTFLRARK